MRTTPNGCGLSADDPALPLQDQAFTASTPDEAVWVRVAAAGHVLGVQIERAAMGRGGNSLSERIMACHDVAYLEGQLAQRAVFLRAYGPAVVQDMPTEQDLAAARDRLNRM
jgi:Protein of unknown function (DUF2694)